MKIKKLNLEVQDEKVNKGLLEDIFNQINSRKNFTFWNSKPKGHTDHRDSHSDNFGDRERRYNCTYHQDRAGGEDDHGSHTDHVDYREAYSEKHSEYKEYSEYKELPKRHRDYGR